MYRSQWKNNTFSLSATTILTGTSLFMWSCMGLLWPWLLMTKTSDLKSVCSGVWVNENVLKIPSRHGQKLWLYDHYTLDLWTHESYEFMLESKWNFIKVVVTLTIGHQYLSISWSVLLNLPKKLKNMLVDKTTDINQISSDLKFLIITHNCSPVTTEVWFPLVWSLYPFPAAFHDYKKKKNNNNSSYCRHCTTQKLNYMATAFVKKCIRDWPSCSFSEAPVFLIFFGVFMKSGKMVRKPKMSTNLWQLSAPSGPIIPWSRTFMALVRDIFFSLEQRKIKETKKHMSNEEVEETDLTLTLRYVHVYILHIAITILSLSSK